MTTETLPEKQATESSAIGDSVRGYFDRVRGGDLGALPAVLGLIVLCAVFAVLRPVFLSSGNFANLFTQGAGVAIIAMGLIFVLLLGEIDLSAGYASGVCAAVLAVLLTNRGWPWYAAVLAAMLTGVIIGLVLGWLVAKAGIPSFVVTLAAFLGFQGLLLLLVKGGTNISIQDPTILAISNNNVTPILGWTFVAVCVLGYAGVQFFQMTRRRARGITTAAPAVIVLRVVALAVVLGVAMYFLNLERSRNAAIVSLRGMPIVVIVLVVALVLWTFVLTRTAYGRHLYAVGGNAEASRRAGINVDRIRVSAFVICSFMASIGGIIAASRANSVDPNTGGSNVLLYAVGAAVIGGTSLFGGKGRALDAILGGAVVAVIDNGMALMGYSSGVKYVVTGLVLLLAAGVDAVSRRRTAASGRR
ncbi:ABC transporter permease [Streptosporangiaceae bacterium NEAU-GS5]|nr:ABC transporter permease [Streptosporangiaceae bacterium NEAU-GS5]